MSFGVDPLVRRARRNARSTLRAPEGGDLPRGDIAWRDATLTLDGVAFTLPAAVVEWNDRAGQPLALRRLCRLRCAARCVERPRRRRRRDRAMERRAHRGNAGTLALGTVTVNLRAARRPGRRSRREPRRRRARRRRLGVERRRDRGQRDADAAAVDAACGRARAGRAGHARCRRRRARAMARRPALTWAARTRVAASIAARRRPAVAAAAALAVAHSGAGRTARTRHRRDGRLPLLFRPAILPRDAVGFLPRPALAQRANGHPFVVPADRGREHGAGRIAAGRRPRASGATSASSPAAPSPSASRVSRCFRSRGSGSASCMRSPCRWCSRGRWFAARCWRWSSAHCVIAAGNLFANAFFDSRATGWLGFVTAKPQTEDYVPLFPWTGVLLSASRPATRWRARSFRPIAFAGRVAALDGVAGPAQPGRLHGPPAVADRRSVSGGRTLKAPARLAVTGGGKGVTIQGIQARSSAG